MADLNQLLQNVDSVPTVPTSGVQVVNPLAAITAGNQAAQSEFQTRQARMSTGAQQSALLASQTITLARNGSDENLAASFANIRASNMFDPQFVEQEYARWKAMSKPEREANAERIGIVHGEQLSRILGTTSIQNTGGQLEGVTSVQPAPGRAGYIYSGGSVPTTLSPGEATELVTVHTPEGIDVQMPRELADRAVRMNPRLQELNPGYSYRSPGPAGGRPDVGGGGSAPSVTPPPPHPGNTTRPAARPQSSLQTGGVPVAATDPSMVPQTGAPGAPSPFVPGDVADIQAGMAQARGSPRPPGTQIAYNGGTPPPAAQQFQPTAARADAVGSPARTGPTRWGEQPPPGFGTQQDTGAKAATTLESEAQNARSTTQPLLTAMLPELEAIKNTGVGQKTLSFMQQMAIRSGMAPPKFDPTKPQASMEALGKIFAQYQAAQLSALGAQPSDSRQTLAEATSPSMSYSSAGNRLIVHRLMGTNDALDTMYSAWMNSRTRTSNPGNFTAWREAFTAPVQSGPLAGARFDPTVFAVNRLPTEDQKQYLTDLRKTSPNDYQQFTKNWALGLHEGWVKPLNAPPTSGDRG